MIKVTVAMITYNHQDYVQEAIESVMMQKCNFEYQLIINDDYSTDKTREIIEKLHAKYPDKIIPVYQNQNKGMIKNFLENANICINKSEYVATLEGDDYWTDPFKLQKQVDFLEKNKDYSFCFGKVKVLHQDGSKYPFIPDYSSSKLTPKNLLKENFIHTTTVMYRSKILKNVIDNLSEEFFSLNLLDWPLYILCAELGHFGFIDNVLGNYRIHPNGVWSGSSKLKKHMNILDFYKVINKHTNFKYNAIIKDQIFLYGNAVKTGNFEIYTCDFLLGGLTFGLGKLDVCCMNDGEGPYSICDFNGGDIPIDMITTAKDEIIRKNNSDFPYPCCIACPLSKKTLLEKDNSSFNILNFNFFTDHNQDDIYGHLNINIISTLESMIQKKQLKHNVNIHWFCREPVNIVGFNEIIDLVTSVEAFHYINSNAIVFSEKLYELLSSNKAELCITLDFKVSENYGNDEKRDYFDTIWNNIARYVQTGGNVVLKYIFTIDNYNEKNVADFIKSAKEIGVKNILFDLKIEEFDQTIKKAVLLAIEETYKQGIKSSIVCSTRSVILKEEITELKEISSNFNEINHINKKLLHIQDKYADKNIYFYGNGKYLTYFFNKTNLKKLNIKGIFDAKPDAADKHNRIPIFPAESIKKHSIDLLIITLKNPKCMKNYILENYKGQYICISSDGEF